MKKFIGRAAQKKAFMDSLSQIFTNSKKPIFLKKEKKPVTQKPVPRLFLFHGEGGLGKTSLVDECIRMAKERARKNKEEIKIFKLDWDDCYNRKSILPDNVYGIIKELYSVFSKTVPGPEKYFDQFLQKEQKIYKVHKDFKGEGSDDELSEALVSGVIELSKDYPLLLAVDAYERVDRKNVDQWFRDVILKGILESQARIIVILSGKNNHVELYRKQFTGSLMHHAFFDDLLFTVAEIKEYTKACGLKFKENDLNTLLRFTRGIPMVVVEVCNLINEGLSLHQVLASLISIQNIKSIIQDMIKVYLKYCDPETGERVFNIAMQHRCNPNILAHLWNLSEKATLDYLSNISKHHSFIHNGRLHPRVHEFLRNYIINDLLTKKPALFKKFGKKCRDLLAPKMEEFEGKAATLEELYSDENYLVTILEYLNALMWWDSGEAIEHINKSFLDLLEFRREIIPGLNKILFEFDPILTPEQKKNVDALVTGFLDYKFSGEISNRPPGKSEIELLSSLTTYKKSFSPRQLQLLYYKWGEIYFRSGEYEKAVKILDITSDLIKISARIKKNVIRIYILIGENQLKEGKYSSAFDSLNKALQLDPGNTEALCTRGNVYHAAGESDKALADFKKVIELNPLEAKAYKNRGDIYYAKKEYDNALEDYNRAIELGLPDAEAYHNRGIIYSARGEYDKALADYNQALEINPEDVMIYYRRGNIYHARREYEKALVDYSLAIELELEIADVYLKRGGILKANGEYDKALADFSRVIKLNPQDKTIFYHRGDMFHAKGEHGKALSDYERAVEINPEYAETCDDRGISYNAKREFEKELVECKQAIEADPQDASAYYNRGNIYDALGEYDNALADYNQAIELDPQDAEFFSSRAIIYHMKGEYKKALLDYSWAMELDPEDASLYYNRGNTFDVLNEYDKALIDYTRAIELDPQDADAFNNRGTIYHFKGEYKKALADYDRALELDPQSASIYYNRGNTYDALKEYNKAQADYDQAIELDPEEPTAYLLLAQLYIVINNFPGALETTKKTLALSLDKDDKAYCLYFEYIARTMLDMELTECEAKLDNILKEDFVSTWSHSEIESWLASAKIPADKKTPILEKTNLLKLHKK